MILVFGPLSVGVYRECYHALGHVWCRRFDGGDVPIAQCDVAEFKEQLEFAYSGAGDDLVMDFRLCPLARPTMKGTEGSCE